MSALGRQARSRQTSVMFTGISTATILKPFVLKSPRMSFKWAHQSLPPFRIVSTGEGERETEGGRERGWERGGRSRGRGRGCRGARGKTQNAGSFIKSEQFRKEMVTMCSSFTVTPCCHGGTHVSIWRWRRQSKLFLVSYKHHVTWPPCYHTQADEEDVPSAQIPGGNSQYAHLVRPVFRNTLGKD